MPCSRPCSAAKRWGQEGRFLTAGAARRAPLLAQAGFLKNAKDVVSPGMKLPVVVLKVDVEKKRLSLAPETPFGEARAAPMRLGCPPPHEQCACTRRRT